MEIILIIAVIIILLLGISTIKSMQRNATLVKEGSEHNAQIARLQKRLQQKNIELHCTEESLDYLADKGYQPDLGARPVKRAVQKYVIDKLSIFMIEGSTQEACKVEMFLANDELQFRFI